MSKATASERFWAKVDKGWGDWQCWLWKAAVTPKGYGIFRAEGRIVRAHRWAWIEANGPIPEGMEIDHRCRVRSCVNPAHLEAVTHLENVRRGGPATKTHCKNGHPLTPDNLYNSTRTRRRCRGCGY